MGLFCLRNSLFIFIFDKYAYLYSPLTVSSGCSAAELSCYLLIRQKHHNLDTQYCFGRNSSGIDALEPFQWCCYILIWVYSNWVGCQVEHLEEIMTLLRMKCLNVSMLMISFIHILMLWLDIMFMKCMLSTVRANMDQHLNMYSFWFQDESLPYSWFSCCF